MVTWQLQNARARLGNVVDAVLGGEAQLITRRGKPAVVVVAASEYERLRRAGPARMPGFIDHLLSMRREKPARGSR